MSGKLVAVVRVIAPCASLILCIQTYADFVGGFYERIPLHAIGAICWMLLAVMIWPLYRR